MRNAVLSRPVLHPALPCRHWPYPPYPRRIHHPRKPSQYMCAKKVLDTRILQTEAQIQSLRMCGYPVSAWSSLIIPGDVLSELFRVGDPCV